MPRFFLSSLWAVSLALQLPAQVPAGSPARPPATGAAGAYTPPSPGVAPRALNSAGQPSAPATPPDGTLIKVNFPNTPIQGIIPFYQQLTGKMMILDGSLQGESLKIIGTRPLTKDEALAFIEASLLLNGYAIIDVDPQTVKLIHHSGGKHPSSENIPVYSSISDLPDKETIVHFVLPLQYISPDEAVKAFTTVIKLHAYGAITPVTNTSNIIITENTATIRSIFDLAQVVDVPPAEMKDEMIELFRADAESVAEIINEIYEQKEESQNAIGSSSSRGVQGSTQGQPAPATPNIAGQIPTPGGAMAQAASTNPTAAKVRVIPYRRTNSLLVIARPVDITYIKGLVEKLDREAGESNFLQRKLRYMAVADFLSVARDALSRDTDIESDGSDSTGGSSASPRRRTRTTDDSQSNNNRSNQNVNVGFNGGGFNGGFGNGFGSTSSRPTLGEPEDAGAPESVVVGKTLLIAEPGSNTLIVNGSPEHISIIDKLIETMDIRPQQIYISTLIGQLNLGDQYDYGFDMLRALDDFTLRSRPTDTGNAPGTGTNTGTTPGTTTGASNIPGTAASTLVPGGVTSGTAGAANQFSLQAPTTPGLIELPFNLGDFNWNSFNLYGSIGSLGRYIHLLEGVKDFRVLSRPSVYTKNNGKALISSGQKVAVPVSSLYGGGVGVGGVPSVSSAIDYRDVVLELEVIPLINSDDEVTLQIAQVNDNIVGSQNIGGNSVPTIATQTLSTEVTVKDGSTVVLGGLITERESKTENGVVFLRRIPILKQLFNRTETNKTREELLIFIQPTIVKSTDSLDKPNQMEMDRTKAFGTTMDFGTRKIEPERSKFWQKIGRKP
jgi:general secretion pathway protein D